MPAALMRFGRVRGACERRRAAVAGAGRRVAVAGGGGRQRAALSEGVELNEVILRYL